VETTIASPKTERYHERLPIHESLLEVITIAVPAQMLFLAKWLKITIVQEGHDEIIAALEVRQEQLTVIGLGFYCKEAVEGLIANLLVQKMEHYG